jgi:hypothetical protein
LAGLVLIAALLVALGLRASAVNAAGEVPASPDVDGVLDTLIEQTEGAEQSAVRPGPGLGPSKDEPSGQAISPVLPPGYQLARVRGDSGDVPARGGAFDIALVLSFDAATFEGQNSNRSACVAEPVWRGWLLPSEDGEAQNIWAPVAACRTVAGTETPILDLPVPSDDSLVDGLGTLEVSVGGYCVNLDRDLPGAGHSYVTGVFSDDPGLLQVLGVIADKNLEDFGNISTIQDVIWDYTDFEGLTPEDLERLAAMS